MSISASQVTRMGLAGGIWRPVGDFTGKAGDTTAPILSSPTGTATGQTTADGTVSTDEGNGTLYYYASTNATETAATIKASGDSQAVTGSGVQNVSVTGLTADTSYYLHYVQDDNATNESNVVTSAAFTTDAGSTSFTGGFFFQFEQIQLKAREKERQELKRLEEQAKQLQNKMDRELNEAFQKQVKEDIKLEEYKRVSELASKHKQEVKKFGEKIEQAAQRAIEKQTFSSLEALTRQLQEAKEEEDFLIEITMTLFNQ